MTIMRVIHPAPTAEEAPGPPLSSRRKVQPPPRSEYRANQALWKCHPPGHQRTVFTAVWKSRPDREIPTFPPRTISVAKNT
jgi:hypothetical protein